MEHMGYVHLQKTYVLIWLFFVQADEANGTEHQQR